MDEIATYVSCAAELFSSRLGSSLVEVYTLGSLAHGGFSPMYSDIDVGVLFSCASPPAEMERLITEAKNLDPLWGKKLSVFWGNPDCSWGRLPVLDRLDLLDHGVPLLNNRRGDFRRPTKEEIRQALRESIERSWKPRIAELIELKALAPQDRKPYIRAILYPARLIYSWDQLEVNSNDIAVEYLRGVQPRGLDRRPIELALECRRDRCSAEDVFALKVDFNQLFKATMGYLFRS